ncbi:hypothetical protein FALBO_6351 [Fusarium albosuccineum]|uniref:F-box domain-containing protein n=1 Tax=Fusarium albosuccineum TaxID=1237068 RepID=A0A8H4LC95_9HYPO|nr:hypothetical protein FALBO_6351 [Fusarium albosuccineum]
MGSLPDEIWHQIFSEFEDVLPLDRWWMYGCHLKHETAKDLLSLSLVCRQFHRIIQPIIHRSIILVGRGDDDSVAHTNFLRTLGAHPELGQSTRVVSVANNLPSGYQLSKLGDSFLQDHINPILEGLELPPAFARRLRKRLFGDPYRDVEGFAALVIASMPNVELVDCTIEFEHPMLPWILSGANWLDEKDMANPYDDSSDDEEDEDEDEGEDENPDDTEETKLRIKNTKFANYGLPNLKEVRIRTESGDEGSTHAFMMEPLLLHPSLKTLRTLGMDWCHDEVEVLKWPNHVSNLMYLDLKECLIDATGFQAILTRCPCLVGLSIQMACCLRAQDRDQDSWEVDLVEFGRILRHDGRRLESFELHTLDYEDANSTDGILGSLRELESLKHLKVMRKDLVGREIIFGEVDPDAISWEDALPPWIETLYLHWDGSYFSKSWFETMREGLAKELCDLIAGGQFPNLHKIEWERPYDEKPKEWEPEVTIDGWDISTREEHLWERQTSTGCMRTILLLSKKS